VEAIIGASETAVVPATTGRDVDGPTPVCPGLNPPGLVGPGLGVPTWGRGGGSRHSAITGRQRPLMQ
jgi:hypothetical protein